MPDNLFLRASRKARSYVDLVIASVVDGLYASGAIKKLLPEAATNLGPELNVDNPYPENFDPADIALFSLCKRYETHSLDLWRLKNAAVASNGVVYKGARLFVQALPHPVFRRDFGSLFYWRTKLFSKKLKGDPAKNYLLIFDDWSKNSYYHWLVDSLCRLFAAGLTARQECSLLLYGDAPAFVKDSLKKFGITDITVIPRNQCLKIQNLCVMSYAAGSGRVHPAIITQVRQYLLDHTLLPANAKPKKIYVSRGRQKTRRISNEQEVIRLLESEGFTVVYFEGMSLDEQIQLMQGVTHYISSHGANMTNILFLPKEAKILELIRNDAPNFCYWALAAGLSLSYRYQLCPLKTADHIHVDLAALKKNLDALLDR